MNYQIKVRFLVLVFVCQSLLCMKIDNSFGSEYKGTFGGLYINNMETQPTKPTIKIKELKQGTDLNQNLRVPVFNNQNNNQPVNQNQNLQMPVFNNNQNNNQPIGQNRRIQTNSIKPKTKSWFDSLSNNWKAFLINMGTGIGAAIVDTAISSIPIKPSLHGIVTPAYFATYFGYPLVRYSLYKKFLVEGNKSYGDIIEQNEKRYLSRQESPLDTKQSPHYLRDTFKSELEHHNRVLKYDIAKTRLETLALSSLLTSNIAWLLTHLLLGYAMSGKKSEDNI